VDTAGSDLTENREVTPAAMTRLGEVFVTSRWDSPAQASEVTEPR
jgi:hypothetical protein